MRKLLAGTLDLAKEGYGITASGNGSGTAGSSLDNIIDHSQRALGEGSHLKYTLGSIPEDGVGAGYNLRVSLNSLGTNVETHPAIIDASCNITDGGLSGFLELICNNVVQGQVDLDTLFFGLLHDLRYNLSSFLVKQRLADVGIANDTVKSESHSATNDHLINEV